MIFYGVYFGQGETGSIARTLVMSFAWQLLVDLSRHLVLETNRGTGGGRAEGVLVRFLNCQVHPRSQLCIGIKLLCARYCTYLQQKRTVHVVQSQRYVMAHPGSRMVSYHVIVVVSSERRFWGGGDTNNGQDMEPITLSSNMVVVEVDLIKHLYRVLGMIKQMQLIS